MVQISREDFIDICFTSIIKTRDKIVAANQKSGYKKFHLELRDNDYLEYFRDSVYLIRYGKPHDDNLFLLHEIIRRIGIGNCREFAEHLIVEIQKSLREFNTQATLYVVKSAKYDHVYNRISIELLNEKFISHWEVDAWDPRLIDISIRPEGSIKNYEALEYGYDITYINSLTTHSLKSKKLSFFNIRSPIEGTPTRAPTPEREITTKHSDIYSDNTIENALEEKTLCFPSHPHFLQKVSMWQKNSSEPPAKKQKTASPAVNTI